MVKWWAIEKAQLLELRLASLLEPATDEWWENLMVGGLALWEIAKELLMARYLVCWMVR